MCPMPKASIVKAINLKKTIVYSWSLYNTIQLPPLPLISPFFPQLFHYPITQPNVCNYIENINCNQEPCNSRGNEKDFQKNEIGVLRAKFFDKGKFAKPPRRMNKPKNYKKQRPVFALVVVFKIFNQFFHISSFVTCSSILF